MVEVQLATMFIQPLLDVGNNFLVILVAKHRPTMWLIFIGIRVT